jgi:hypothetical protein
MKDPGCYVTTKSGKKGRTFINKGLINGKIPVYTFANQGTEELDPTPILCSSTSLTITGYID